MKTGVKMDTNISTIKTYWGKKSYADIGKLTNQSANAVRCMGRRLGLPALDVSKRNSHHKITISPEKAVERDLVLDNLSEEKKVSARKYKILAEKLATSEAKLKAYQIVSPKNHFVIKSNGLDSTNEATAVAVLSDSHYEEIVNPNNVNGKNEYSPEISNKRIETFFVSLVKLIKIFSKESKIDKLVLALLGDFINGQLREEAMENNAMQPMEAMWQVHEILSAGIKYLLANTTLNITIPCHSGNHARTTKKIHVSTEAGNSLEYVMYQILSKEFKDNKRIKFIIPTGYHSFIDIAGYIIRFSHGHAMKYQGGVGGIYISVNKAIAQWNKVEHADLDVFAHFHQFRDGGNFICNGSVIGWNEFANFIKADYERPKQAFFLVDHKRREKTVTAPIFVN